MNRCPVVQRIGEGLLTVAFPAGVVIILKEGDSVGLWIAVGGIAIGGMMSWIGKSRRDREPAPPFDLEPMDGTGRCSERSEP